MPYIQQAPRTPQSTLLRPTGPWANLSFSSRGKQADDHYAVDDSQRCWHFALRRSRAAREVTGGSLAGSLQVSDVRVVKSADVEHGIIDCRKAAGVDAAAIARPSTIASAALLEVFVLGCAVEREKLVTATISSCPTIFHFVRPAQRNRTDSASVVPECASSLRSTAHDGDERRVLCR
ncbi:uncharacterized protein M421DRAFT_93297 [Didymella exigua CBS 183.55]|uniref:Uncharacterized protein n=1 Tax=Didymella exigua CBS 183.55 TaxID=1150837 RepID=A0A6A5RIM7_9PLEO|nr:uncharacterized protein M421DRAFT_93297 [Didymella exigua CBS 183.55]KAF1927449.1 hypothetical protein M421DRAFT_93297 [Didymella exigua CBS 183.55]